MGLKEDIVIKNEFTVNRNGAASRGATPGRYVQRYMARLSATETLSPVGPKDIEDFQLRYMARKAAVDRAVSKDGIYHEFAEQQGQSGVAFSNDNISLTDKELKEYAKRIQSAFDDGHTVQKIVLSFTEDFLRNHAIVDENFRMSGPGSYRGNIDQLKLRHAIMNGVNAMTEKSGYSKPVFIGVIQVDTKHVHAHIALTDEKFSDKRLIDTGKGKEETGKLSERSKRHLRRGIYVSLSELSSQHSFRNQVDLERRNIVQFVSNFAQRKLYNSSKLQILMASLPSDKRLWRVNSKAFVMRRPNELAAKLVSDIFEQYPEKSGYNRYKKTIAEYVAEKSKNENLTEVESENLTEAVNRTLLQRSINALYEVIKGYDYEQDVSTDMISICANDTEELKRRAEKNDDLVAFELRLRSFRDRAEYHSEMVDFYRNLYKGYLKSPKVEESYVVADFFEEELEYHRSLFRKYSHFLKINEDKDENAIDEGRSLYSRYARLENKRDVYFMLLNDPPEHLVKMKPVERDAMIKSVYGIDEGSWFFDSQLSDYKRDEFRVVDTDYRMAREDYENYLFEHNLNVERTYVDDDYYRLASPDYEISSDMVFDDVKALDMHQMTFDYPGGASVSDANIARYESRMRLRRELFDDAMSYFVSTGQDISVFGETRDDLETMESFYDDELLQRKAIPPVKPQPVSETGRSLAPHIEEIPSEEEAVSEALSSLEESVAAWQNEISSEPTASSTSLLE